MLNQDPVRGRRLLLEFPIRIAQTVKAVIARCDEFEGTANAEQMIAFCKERLATYKRPRVVSS